MKTEEYYDDLLAKITSIQLNDHSEPIALENSLVGDDYHKNIDDLHCKLDDCINNIKNRRVL